jgi:hypothetical protein
LAAEQNRILVTHDLKTVPRLAYQRLSTGHSMPGVIVVPRALPIGQVIDELAMLVECGQPHDLENLVSYLPL